MSQIARTKSLLEEVNQIIANKQAHLREAGGSRGAMLSLKNLEIHRDELEKELRIANESRFKEIISLRFKGSKAQYGTLPLGIAGGLSKSFSDAIFQTSKYLKFGAKGGKQIENIIHETIDLRLEDIASGSTILYISGKTSPDSFGNSLIQDTFSNAFDLFKCESSNEIAGVISNLGTNSVKYYTDFFGEINNSDLEIEVSWNTPNNELMRWNGTKDKVAKLYNALNQIEIRDPEEIDFEGKLITISSKGLFELITDDNERIKGKFPSELLPTMRSFHVEDECSGRILKEIFFDSFTLKEKAEYTLDSISK